MATRCNIGILNKDGSVTCIYVHFDSYPKYVGNILLNHYTNTDIVNKLMNLGDLSSIGENLSTDIPHSFNYPVEGVCVAYGRDRGEKNSDSKCFNNISEFEKYANRTTADYQYLFNNGKWQYRNHNGTWNELTARVCKCD